MVTIDINSISNAKLKQLAAEIDNSKISAKDNLIDDQELGLFKQRAKAELLDKNQITNDDYKAIFGLEKTNNKVNTDSLKYENAISKIETKNKKIEELKSKISVLKNELYGSELANKRTIDDVKKDAKQILKYSVAGGALFPTSVILLGSTMGLKVTAGAALGAICAGAGVGLVGGGLFGGAVIGVQSIIDKYNQSKKEKCEQQNPEIFEALKCAEKELAELQK